MLTQLARAEADLYWLSTEPIDDVPVIFATRLLGCPSLESHVDPTWWKFDALAAAHPHGVPFIWIDPNFGTLRDSQCRFAAEALDSLHSPCLLITPDPAEALSRSELSRVLAFAHRYAVVPV